MQQQIGWFEITKDIIIPGLTLIATVAVGTIIAFLLKNRDEKLKRKSILIDTYMEYMKLRVDDTSDKVNYFFTFILNELITDEKKYLRQTSNWHLNRKVIIERFDIETKNYKKSVDSWVFYPEKFSFLIGSKKYSKDVKKLEENIAYYLQTPTEVQKYFYSLKEKIFADEYVTMGLTSSNLNETINALNKMEGIIASDYNRFEKKIFEPYNQKISELIQNL